jgi:hypothetical protein
MPNVYADGNWIDQAASDFTQWMAVAYQTFDNDSPNIYPNQTIVQGSIVFNRLDNVGGPRFLCHTYNLGDVNGTEFYYRDSLWPNMSADGKFMLFKSNMHQPGGALTTFSSLFAAIMPTTAGVPDPSLLPAANSIQRNYVAYDALNVPSRPVGFTYQDPTSGVTIVKLTTATAPVPGTANRTVAVDYAGGLNRISRPT